MDCNTIFCCPSGFSFGEWEFFDVQIHLGSCLEPVPWDKANSCFSFVLLNWGHFLLWTAVFSLIGEWCVDLQTGVLAHPLAAGVSFTSALSASRGWKMCAYLPIGGHTHTHTHTLSSSLCLLLLVEVDVLKKSCSYVLPNNTKVSRVLLAFPHSSCLPSLLSLWQWETWVSFPTILTHLSICSALVYT